MGLVILRVDRYCGDRTCVHSNSITSVAFEGELISIALLLWEVRNAQ